MAFMVQPAKYGGCMCCVIIVIAILFYGLGVSAVPDPLPAMHPEPTVQREVLRGVPPHTPLHSPSPESNGLECVLLALLLGILYELLT